METIAREMVQQVKNVYQTVEAFARQQPGGYGPWWKKENSIKTKEQPLSLLKVKFPI